MIKRHVSMSEAERRYPSSTVQWEAQGGVEYADSVNANLIRPNRWNILRDVLCVSHQVRRDSPKRGDSRGARPIDEEIAFWVTPGAPNTLYKMWKFRTPSGLFLTSFKTFEGQWMFWHRPHRWMWDRDHHQDWPSDTLVLGTRPPRNIPCVGLLHP